MRVYYEGYGCTQNLGEAETLQGALEAAGHRTVVDPARADVSILVTCGVIETTERHMLRRWHALAERTPRVVVTGCLVPLRTDLFTGPARGQTTFVPIREQAELPRILSGFARGPEAEVPRDTEAAPVAAAPAPPSAAAEVTLAQGCTSHCTYCFSRLARGPLRSVPLAQLLGSVQRAVDAGAREIRLSSLDTACWGEDLPTSDRLPELLAALSGVPGDFRVRIGMMSPQSLSPIAVRYFDALRSSRGFQFLHLPVQSGSDAVLDAMRRGYSVGEFRHWVTYARERLPDLTLSTDVIVGFPTETEADFDATLALVEAVEPEILNVTRFSPRPLTPARHWPPLPARTLKQRSRLLTELRTRLARRRLERWIGHRGAGLVTEHGPAASSVARLPNYLPVVLSDTWPLGTWVPLVVEGARATYLVGRALGMGDPAPPSSAVAL